MGKYELENVIAKWEAMTIEECSSEIIIWGGDGYPCTKEELETLKDATLNYLRELRQQTPFRHFIERDKCR